MPTPIELLNLQAKYHAKNEVTKATEEPRKKSLKPTVDMSVLDALSPQEKALVAEYPYLTPKVLAPSMGDAALAAKNARALLRHTFPHVKTWWVRKNESTTHASMVAECEAFPDAPTQDQVRQVLQTFKMGTFDSMQDCYMYTQDGDARAFHTLFGGVEYVIAKLRSVSLTQIAAWEAKALSKVAHAPVKVSQAASKPRL